MKIPTKKLKTGFEMPVFGLGTWQMGGRKEHDLDNDDEADILSIRTAIDSGITHIDTAEIYANGYSEILHRHNPDLDLKQTIKALDYLVEQDLVKNIGVANFNKEFLAEAQSYTKNKIVCNQVHYNLEFREPEVTSLLNYCQNNDVFLVAWRPVGKGNLLGNGAERYRKVEKRIS